MAGKKKKKGRKSSRPMKVVSLKSALHMVAQASRRIRARQIRRRNPDDVDLSDLDIESNPLRHFPRMKGRGRPAKKRKWTMVTRFSNGAIAEKTFKATQWDANMMAARVARKEHATPSGKSRVVEIMLDDGR